MFSYEFVLAAALLTSAPDTLPIPGDNPRLPALRGAVAKLALDWEILDPREKDGLLVQDKDFPNDIKTLQGRYQDLRHAPFLEECRRFPAEELVTQLLSFNRSYRQDLLARIEVDKINQEVLRASLSETDQLYRVWDTLRDSRSDKYYTVLRRQALGRLRDQVGLEAFYSGRLPPPVPTWRFPER